MKYKSRDSVLERYSYQNPHPIFQIFDIFFMQIDSYLSHALNVHFPYIYIIRK